MSPERPLRVAVVGSGPAGFYAADALLEAGAGVDLLERLPTPWGLVRLGVAPDHPELKTASRVFEKTAAKAGFRFFGNVDVGRDVTHDELVRLFDAVVYTVGAQTDRRLGIPGEDLAGSWAATEFVAWYNGHPDFQELEFDLSSERAVVIGNGNVAIDVARMLARTREELAPTDVTDRSAAAIVASGIREIVMLGRRGPAQAAFTPPELKELGELGGADVAVDPAELELDAASAAALEADRARARRNVDILREFAARAPAGKPKRLELRFRVSPVQILGEGRVEAIEVVRNELVAGEGGAIRAVPTGELEVVPCGLVLRSVGYRGVALPGVPFHEERGVIPNERGRVLGPGGAPLPGVYCAGWIKRGPSGVIGTNKKDAAETVASLLEDAAAGRLPRGGEGELEELLRSRGVRFVEYAGWQAIDRHERGLGEPLGRPRVKLASWDELLETARALDSAA
ncbi:MAG TPA: FAD-dependent oxidoreductase [Gaiellaceae bacterium]|nr:FAD-dependent oxidoreductase [Gaiellaceae bacterium]